MNPFNRSIDGSAHEGPKDPRGLSARGPRMSNALDGLEQEVASLVEILQALQIRLEPVCLPSPPMSRDSSTRPSDMASSTVCRIIGLAVAVGTVREAVANTLERLEV